MRLKLRLLKRGDKYHLRWQLPEDLQSITGKKIFSRSLNTADKWEAVQRSAPLQSQITKIQKIRSMTTNHNEAGYQKLIKKLWSQLQEANTRRPETLEELHVLRAKYQTVTDWYAEGSLVADGRFSPHQPSIHQLTERFIRHVWPTIPMDQIKASDDYGRFLGDVTKMVRVAGQMGLETLSAEHNPPELPDFLQPKSVAATTALEPVDSPLLSEVVEPYTKYKTGKKASLSTASTKAYRDSINDLIYVIGDKPVTTVTFEDAESFRDTMVKLPANRIKSYPGLTAEELLAKDLSGVKLYSSGTIKDKIGYLKGIFKWLKQTKKVDSNPFELTTIEVVKVGHSQYNTEDLKTIFSSDLYAPSSDYFNHQNTTPSHWWLPLLALFTGARPGELMQLTVEDVKSKDGIMYFDLLDEEESKKLKTSAARRIVPVHKQLIDLELQDYVDTLDSGRLLHRINLYSASPSAAAGQWYNERYRGRGYLPKEWKEQKKTLYSFRSTHITNALNNGVEQRLLQEIVGHEKSHLGATRHYDRGAPLDLLKTAIDTVVFDGLDLSVLIGQWKRL